jgi:hypothetical protein
MSINEPNQEWPSPEEQQADGYVYWHNRATELRAENERLVEALNLARIALLNIEKRCEEVRAELTRITRQS